MTISSEDLDPARTGVFPRSIELDDGERTLLFSVLDRVARAVGQRAPRGDEGTRVARAGAAFRRRLAPGGPVELEAVLDLAAELLEVADELLATGLEVEALALEGVGGRLTERLVGCGPFEGTPLGVGR